MSRTPVTALAVCAVVLLLGMPSPTTLPVQAEEAEPGVAVAHLSVPQVGQWFEAEVIAGHLTRIHIENTPGFSGAEGSRVRVRVRNAGNRAVPNLVTVVRPSGRSHSIVPGQVTEVVLRVQDGTLQPLWIDNTHSESNKPLALAVFI
jgi:hypothetical protein